MSNVKDLTGMRVLAWEVIDRQGECIEYGGYHKCRRAFAAMLKDGEYDCTLVAIVDDTSEYPQ